MAIASIYHYQGGPDCEENCCTAYTFGPTTKCEGVNDSNTLDTFWGWLQKDQFTGEPATYIQHDKQLACDVWSHNSKPIYPKDMQQTACVNVNGSVPVPV
jgi:hypothetical protein